MDFHLMEQLDELGVAVVHNLAVLMSSLAISDISSSLSRKAQMSIFCTMRSLWTDLGMTVTPLKYGADCAEHYNQSAY